MKIVKQVKDKVNTENAYAIVKPGIRGYYKSTYNDDKKTILRLTPKFLSDDQVKKFQHDFFVCMTKTLTR